MNRETKEITRHVRETNLATDGVNYSSTLLPAAGNDSAKPFTRRPLDD